MAYNPYFDTPSFTHTLTSSPFLFDDRISTSDLARLNEELEYWKFYLGIHWNHKREEGEPQNTLNYSRAFVDKGVAFLMGNGWTLQLAEEAEAICKEVLEEVWEDNQKELLSVELAQMGGVSGNSFVKVAVEEYDPKVDPEMAELYPKGRIRIILLPSHSVLPIWDNHDRDRLVKVLIGYPIIVEDSSGKPHSAWYREEITALEIREYLDNQLIDSRPNALRKIPVVRVKNIPVAGESLGISDLKDIVPLQKELNEKTTNISDIIDYHAAPITIIKGAKGSHLEKGARKIWSGLPKDSDVYNLELKTDLSALTNYVDIIKNAMFEIGHIPEDALGVKSNISNTTGIAMHIKNQPLLDITNIKQKTYGSGITEISRLVLDYAKLIEYEGFNISAYEALKPKVRREIKVSFPSPLPKDELIQMQLIAQKMALNLESRIQALKELGDNDPTQTLDDVKKELQEWQKMFPNQTQNFSNNGTNATRASQANDPNNNSGAQGTNLGGVRGQGEKNAGAN